MKIDYAKINGVTGEITMFIDESDYADKVKKQLKEIGRKRPEPGFRAGHVPAGLLEKKYGHAVKYDVINDLVGESLFNYIKEQDLNLLGSPLPDKDNAINEDTKELTLKFKVGLSPDIEFVADKNLHVPYYNIDVTDEMTDRQDEALRRRFGKQAPGDEVDDTALVKGVITELNEDGSVKEDGVVVESGIVAPHYFRSEEQRDIFIGKKVGDKLTFNPAATCDASPSELSSMLNLSKEEAEQHHGDFSFEIKEILVLKPAELGEEYYKDVFGDEVKDEAQYRDAVKKMIETQLKGDQNYRFTIDAEKAITDAIGELELPDDILKEFLISRNEQINAENIDKEYPEIRKQLVWDIEKGAIMKQLNVKVTEEDILNTARMIARNQFAQYGMTNVTDEMLDKYAPEILNDENSRNQITSQAADMKFFAALQPVVTLDEKNVTVEKFNELFKTQATEQEA